MSKKKVAAIIVAAGRGTRLKLSVPKQFYELKGKPILAHTIRKFEDCHSVDEIILVTASEELAACEKMLSAYGFQKIKKLIPGGPDRQASVYNGVLALSPGTDIVLVHDGVRPLVSGQNILDVIEAAGHHPCCVLAVRVKDTIKRCDEGLTVTDTPPRDKLWAVHTPQGFPYSVLLEVHQKARAQGYTGTDDAMLAEHFGYPAVIVPGSYENIKITTADDLALAELLLEMSRKEARQPEEACFGEVDTTERSEKTERGTSY